MVTHYTTTDADSAVHGLQPDRTHPAQVVGETAEHTDLLVKPHGREPVRVRVPKLVDPASPDRILMEVDPATVNPTTGSVVKAKPPKAKRA